MESLVGYGSDDDNEVERYDGNHPSSLVSHCGPRRRDDDGTNYDDVNMDMSEDSQGPESEPELPPAEQVMNKQTSREEQHYSVTRQGSRDSEREKRRYDDRDRRRAERDGRADHRRDSSSSDRRGSSSSDRRNGRPDERRDDKHARGDRDRERDRRDSSRHGLGGPTDDRHSHRNKLPELEASNSESSTKSQDARDAVCPRFVERGRERERDRDRHSRRSEEHRSERPGRSRSRSRELSKPRTHAPHLSAGERRGSPPAAGDYRPSYKVNKKLEVMEKMGLQIKTPDGSMATARQLRAAASEAPPAGSRLPQYYNPAALSGARVLEQVQKRKLLWANKSKSEAEEAARWSGTRFAQDSDGRQASKFMRLMGIKDAAAVKPEAADETADPIKKQEELFQAMQAQYEVARATTHTMRGVGLGFQRQY